MTAQISDEYKYQRKTYSIVAIENEWPFRPENYGFSPVGMMSSCWRGYYSQYKVSRKKLYLSKLNIFLEEIEPQVLKNIVPKMSDKNRDGSFEYEGVNIAINYTGGIIIGRDFIMEFYVHMGYHRPHCFNEVIELIFDKATLIETIDHSDRMRQAREKIKSVMEDEDYYFIEGHNDLIEFIEGSFSLDYKDKWN